MIITRPMLSATVKDIDSLTYPLLATPKIDGIRCLVDEHGNALSRTFKDIPNYFIRACIKSSGLCNTDGELVVGKNFQDTSSGVMSEDGEPDFTYKVFDYFIQPAVSYVERIDMLQARVDSLSFPCHEFLYPERIDNPMQLQMMLDYMIEAGHEGVMLRRPDSPYKCGRSTLKEGYLMKLKPFADSEAIILDVIQKMHNANRLEEDNFGLAKRSHCQDDMVPVNTMGALLVMDTITLTEFYIGTGFDDELRKKIWSEQSRYIGKTITYKYQKHGMKDKPRCPVFLRFRDDINI